LPGMYVTLEVNLGEQRGVFLIPQAAVQRDTSGTYVMVVGQDGKVIRHNVNTNTMRDGDWVITGGLKVGDQVVVSGLQKVKEGAPAKATPWQPTQQNDGQAPTTTSDTTSNST